MTTNTDNDTQTDNATDGSRPKQPKLARFVTTDSGNAELFADMYQADIRFDHRQKRWLIWDGARWQEDREGQILQKAKAVARWRWEASKAFEDPDEGKRQRKSARSSES